jgi:RNA polymerase sigma-70 factor (ECF subfamily)
MHAMAAPIIEREPTDAPHGLDDVTLRRAQNGDHAAWRVLVDCFSPRVHALIWRLLAGRAQHRAPDLTQETFVRVLRALPKFETRGAATLSTWILTIATRLALNELRRPEPALLADEPIGSAQVDRDVERKRLGEAIAAGVAALPDAQRAVLVLREYHELDYAEIASVLELDLGTVKSRLSRARAELRAFLTARGVDR